MQNKSLFFLMAFVVHSFPLSAESDFGRAWNKGRKSVEKNAAPILKPFTRNGIDPKSLILPGLGNLIPNQDGKFDKMANTPLANFVIERVAPAKVKEAKAKLENIRNSIKLGVHSPEIYLLEKSRIMIWPKQVVTQETITDWLERDAWASEQLRKAELDWEFKPSSLKLPPASKLTLAEKKIAGEKAYLDIVTDMGDWDHSYLPTPSQSVERLYNKLEKHGLSVNELDFVLGPTGGKGKMPGANLLTAALILAHSSLVNARPADGDDSVLRQRFFVVAFLAKLSQLGKLADANQEAPAEILLSLEPFFFTLAELLVKYDVTDVSANVVNDYVTRLGDGIQNPVKK